MPAASPRRALLVAASALMAGATLAGPAAAQVAPAAGTITAIGTGTVKPVPTDPNNNDSIAKAVSDAKHQAIPRAVADARARAGLLAAAGGLRLGPVVGISDDAGSPYFGFYGPYGSDGTFGPGKFCGLVTHYRVTRTPDGRFHRTPTGRTRRCRVPARITAIEAVTFTAAP